MTDTWVFLTYEHELVDDHHRQERSTERSKNHNDKQYKFVSYGHDPHSSVAV